MLNPSSRLLTKSLRSQMFIARAHSLSGRLSKRASRPALDWKRGPQAVRGITRSLEPHASEERLVFRIARADQQRVEVCWKVARP